MEKSSNRMDAFGLENPTAMRWVVMGVSGAGKSSVASALAAATGGTYVDADDLHPACNVKKMASGQALQDEDRWAWLASVRAAGLQAKPPVYVACSALSNAHRARLDMPGVRFLYLHAPQTVIAERLARREGHFMPATLLASQFTALEAPEGEDGKTFIVNADCALDEVIERALAIVRSSSGTKLAL